MSPVDDVVADLNAALDRLESAIGTDEVETRRALRESLACLYELRVYCKGTSDEETAYYKRAADSQAGKRTEGIVWLRGKKTHGLMAQIAPAIEPLYPSDRTFPGQHTFPGANLTWAATSSLTPATSSLPPARRAKKVDLHRLYEDLVQGQPVLEGLHAARDFLFNDHGPRT